MRKDSTPPTFKRPNFPFHECNYWVDHEAKEIWMKGSFALSMGRKQIQEQHCAGYTLHLVTRDIIDKLKADPDYIYELKQIIKERKDAKEE